MDMIWHNYVFYDFDIFNTVDRRNLTGNDLTCRREAHLRAIYLCPSNYLSEKFFLFFCTDCDEIHSVGVVILFL